MIVGKDAMVDTVGGKTEVFKLSLVGWMNA